MSSNISKEHCYFCTKKPTRVRKDMDVVVCEEHRPEHETLTSIEAAKPHTPSALPSEARAVYINGEKQEPLFSNWGHDAAMDAVQRYGIQPLFPRTLYGIDRSAQAASKEAMERYRAAMEEALRRLTLP